VRDVKNAIKVFEKECDNHPELAELVYIRAEKYLVDMKPIPPSSFGIMNN
jgi:hypothetical protein